MNLVIGGTGLVGSHLIYELLLLGEKVRVLHRPGSDKIQILNTFRYYTSEAEIFYNLIEWAPGDIMNYTSILQALDGIKHVYHCAAMVSFSPKDRELLLRNNVDGTANVVNACLNRKGIKLCFVSSIAALGHSDNSEEVTEAHSWKPNIPRSVYSVSKFKSEMEVWRGIEEGLDAVIVNPAVIIGSGNWQKSSSAFFPLVYKGLKFYTKGITGFVDVRDVVKAMVLLTNSSIKNDRFILSAKSISFKELFDLIARSLNVEPPKYLATPVLLKIASKLDSVKSSLTSSPRTISDDAIIAAVSCNSYSNKKVKEALGFQFRPVEETMSDCAKYFLNNIRN